MKNFRYPATMKVDQADFHLVTFPDVPEAGTDAATRDEALHAAPYALIAALGGYVADRRPIPQPSRTKPGQVVISLPTIVTAKLALYEAMRETGVSNAGLGRREKGQVHGNGSEIGRQGSEFRRDDGRPTATAIAVTCP